MPPKEKQPAINKALVEGPAQLKHIKHHDITEVLKQKEKEKLMEEDDYENDGYEENFDSDTEKPV